MGALDSSLLLPFYLSFKNKIISFICFSSLILPLKEILVYIDCLTIFLQKIVFILLNSSYYLSYIYKKAMSI